ncbi:RNA-splicing factor [Diatrype stigma]|uniref:RNA-splicing factor n=1 Tax=Diatrype stigma TaxID=117547 RepID=A0AAN9YIU9_9PEZI
MEVHPGSISAERWPALLINERDELGLLVRRLSVKLGNSRLDDEDLKGEIKWLNKLRGSAHIVQIVAAKDIPVDPGQGPRGRRNARPVLVTEFMQNGTLDEFFNRVMDSEEEIPNRILWSIFLCHTTDVGSGGEVPIETEFVPDGEDPINLVHRDMHMGNVMIGELDPGEDEHKLCPIVKLIDFGSATVLPLDPT